MNDLVLFEGLLDPEYRKGYAQTLCEEFIQKYPEAYFTGLPFTPPQWVSKAVEAALMDAYWEGREDERLMWKKHNEQPRTE